MELILTEKEIEEQFDGEYVLVENPVIDKETDMLRGVVRFHSFSRDEVYEEAVRLKLKSSAFLCNAKVPDNIRLIL